MAGILFLGKSFSQDKFIRKKTTGRVFSAALFAVQVRSPSQNMNLHTQRVFNVLQRTRLSRCHIIWLLTPSPPGVRLFSSVLTALEIHNFKWNQIGNLHKPLQSCTSKKICTEFAPNSFDRYLYLEGPIRSTVLITQVDSIRLCFDYIAIVVKCKNNCFANFERNVFVITLCALQLYTQNSSSIWYICIVIKTYQSCKLLNHLYSTTCSLAHYTLVTCQEC